MKEVRNAFERVLWNSRFLTLIAVVASLFASLAMFYVATIDAINVAGEVLGYGNMHLEDAKRAYLRTEILTGVAGFIDGYLFAVILIIFAVGIYELFIDELDAAQGTTLAQRVLYVKNFDELKDKLAKVILLILIVRYFEYALHSDITTGLDVLYLGIGIALVAFALYISKAKSDEH